MSIGTGIVIATVLIIAAWQIDKRKAWRKTGFWIAGGIIVLSVVAGALIWRDERESEQRRVEELVAARDPDGRTYGSLRIGMTKNEVRYARGEPTKITEGEDGRFSEVWIFSDRIDDPVGRYFVFWDQSDRVGLIHCSAISASGCERIDGFLGVEIGSTEAHLRQVLGTPSDERAPDEKGVKSLRYDGDRNSWVFFLQRDSVESIALVSSSLIADTSQTSPPPAP